MTTATATTSPRITGASALPRAASVLAVTARPGQESADLGGLLFAFRQRTLPARLDRVLGEHAPCHGFRDSHHEAGGGQ
jgi:hypothetical protein